MQVRILCATALGNHVAVQPCYYCNKSQFMIMTQEEIIGTYASGTGCATFMHIQSGHLGSTLCSSENSRVTYVIMWGDVNLRQATKQQMTFPNTSKMTLVCECKCEQWLIQLQRAVAATDGERLSRRDFTDTCSGTCLRCLSQIVWKKNTIFYKGNESPVLNVFYTMWGYIYDS